MLYPCLVDMASAFLSLAQRRSRALVLLPVAVTAPEPSPSSLPRSEKHWALTAATDSTVQYSISKQYKPYCSSVLPGEYE